MTFQALFALVTSLVSINYAAADARSDCTAVLDFYKRTQVPVTESQGMPGIVFSGDVSPASIGLAGGVISVICSETGAITIFGNNIKIQKVSARAAIKALSKVFLLNAGKVKHTKQQESFFVKTAGTIQNDTDWHELKANRVHIRVMTVPSRGGDYLLAISSGFEASAGK